MSPTDDDTDIRLSFPYLESRGGKETFRGFAGADVAVMADGTVSIVSGEVFDWVRDSNGDWIKN